MQYRTMKKTGDRLSVLGFGCMRLPDGNMRLDEGRSAALLHAAVERGVNYLDTAFPYHNGKEEPFLGKLMQNGLRNKVKLATKLPPASVHARGDMDGMLNHQLARLKTDRIEYYMLHAMEEGSWAKLVRLGVLEFLSKARKDGRILHAGFSAHGGIGVFKEMVDAFDWQFCQIQFNYFDSDFQAGTEGLRFAAAKGLGIFVMEPLRGGLLAQQPSKQIAALWKTAPVRRTPAEWGLRWVWNHPEVTVVLSGMNDMAQVEENTRIADQALPDSLSPQELELVEKVRAEYRRVLKIACTSCRYCLPCPKGVDIPTCFDLYNRVASFSEGKFDNLFKYAAQLGGMNGGLTAAASRCTSCGQCVKKCPQHLPIPETLADVKKTFETPFYRLLKFYSSRVLFKARSHKAEEAGVRR